MQENHAWSWVFKVTNMSFNVILENKILEKYPIYSIIKVRQVSDFYGL